MSEGKQLSKTNKHLIKQNIKLELLLTCTPRLGVLTPLYRKGQTPSNGASAVVSVEVSRDKKLKKSTWMTVELARLANSKHPSTERNILPVCGRNYQRRLLSLPHIWCSC
ncbi:hypothetical protein J6590_087170 [Homalodisca vitripennis]|nr:hypothetical protein J6590_087170 [Homalodisca vitripennis]